MTPGPTNEKKRKSMLSISKTRNQSSRESVGGTESQNTLGGKMGKHKSQAWKRPCCKTRGLDSLLMLNGSEKHWNCA